MNSPHHDASCVAHATTIIDRGLAAVPTPTVVRRTFIKHILVLMLMVRGRCNFYNFARYGYYHERSYRYQFEKPFPWLAFNAALVTEHVGTHRILVLDPSYLPKSRNKTPHVGTFWSGCAGKALHGLEITGLAVVDLERRTALHLEAVQTPNVAELRAAGRTLTDHYTSIVVERRDTLAGIAKHLVVDGYFGKRTFIDGILSHTNLTIITKLRHDADLRYLYTGVRRHGPGRPKLFAGKVNWNNLTPDRWEITRQDDHVQLVSAVVYAPSLKRTLMVVVVQDLRDEKPVSRAVLCSSDIALSATTIFSYYTARFQIEFLFRDAKQHAGLTHTRARSEHKLHFHCNASLTAVSVAKIAHCFDAPFDPVPTYALADVGMAYFNEFYTNMIFSRLDIEPNHEKIAAVLPSLLSFGLIHGG